MKPISLWIFLLAMFSGCSAEDQFVRKQIDNGEISLKWYYTSRITNVSPDYVEVSRASGESILLFESVDAVTDVNVVSNQIIIKMYKPERAIVYTNSVPDSVFGLRVVLDSSSSRSEYESIPQGRKM